MLSILCCGNASQPTIKKFKEFQIKGVTLANPVYAAQVALYQALHGVNRQSMFIYCIK